MAVLMTARISLARPFIVNRDERELAKRMISDTGEGKSDVEFVMADQADVVLQDFDDALRRSAMETLVALTRDPETSDYSVAAARKRFSTAEGVKRYAAIYSDLYED